MAGHSKWANIQHRKGAQDKKRGKLFTKLIREITIAARIGGGDMSANPRLRLAIDTAKAQSMPKDNIDRAIKRGSGDLDGSDYQEIRYEGYAPSGRALLVECTTDNRNRTVSEVRHAFSKQMWALKSIQPRIIILAWTVQYNHSPVQYGKRLSHWSIQATGSTSP